MAAQDADALLGSIVDLGRRVFGAAACSLAVLEPDEEHLVFRVASGAGAGEVIGLRLPVNRGIAGWVVSSGQPIAVQDVLADPRFAVDVAESTGYVPRSILATPVIAGGEAIGVMEVLDRSDAAARDDMTLLALLAQPAALAMQLAALGPGPTSVPDAAALMTEVARLDRPERQAAGALLTAFLSYLGRRGGPPGLV